MKAEKQLGVQGRKATFFLIKKNVKNMHLNHKIKVILFDFYIGPISNYGFEIWCIQMGLNVERVHLDL